MVFISHKSDPDHTFALKIAGALEENGISCWYAPERVPVDADYAEEITKAIITCEYFLLILSESTQQSIHVRKELGIAQELGKPLIIIKRGDFKLSYKYRYLLDDHQFMQFDWDDPDFSELVEKCRCGERVVSMEVSQSPRRTISIMRGDFQENMDYLIKTCPGELEHTVFAMGVDRSSRLDISSNAGILKWVCKRLLDDYNVTLDKLQELLDEAKVSQLGHPDGGQEMQFKDSVLLSVPITSDGAELTLQLLLIANSQKNAVYYSSHNVDAVEGVDSREIIIEVFNQCKRLGDRARNLLVGAMGTNGLAFPYEVITAEIMNCFAYSVRTGSAPHNLYYSVREEDMRRHDVTVDEILSYISGSIYFFRE